ncbi:MAG TPA: tetratricopeptide repeat protein [Myxococcales bacterium]|nr:tetratricopeptide repeat protein [Myxococcales bacterium]
MESASWFEEMKRRRVFRTLFGYGIVAFAVLQIAEPVMHGLNLPDWVLSATVVGLGIGFPFVIVLAWALDVRGGRIERTAPAPSKRAVLLLAAVGVAIGAPGVGWYFWKSQHSATSKADIASIAVLPFADLSPAKDQDWMCDGIAEEIIDALCSVNGLRVASRSASFQFKGKSADVRAMTRALGVGALLEGSVRKVDDRLRVSARLVSSDGYELWSDRFDRRVQDAFAIQEEIARSVVTALSVRVSSDEAGRLRRSGTANPQAYEMYLRGRQHFRALGTSNVEMARQMFRRATELDPKFAEAFGGLAEVNINMLQWLLLAKEDQLAARAEAQSASDEALRLNPQLAEGHVARANVLALLGRPDDADESFRKATVLAPGSRDAWYSYGRFLFSVQRYRDAVHAFQQVERQNPDDYDAITLEAMPYDRLGEPDKASATRQRALDAAERVLRNSPDDIRARYLSGSLLMQLGKKKEGAARLEEAIAIQPTDFAVLYNAACGFAFAGEHEKALDLLDRAVGTGKGFRAWMEHDPDLDAVRDLPRFKEILARLPP